MELETYTGVLEKIILRTISNLYQVAVFQESIDCDIHVWPTAKFSLVKWEIQGIRPNGFLYSLEWANDVHKRLRLFPCESQLQVKYSWPRSNWNEGGFAYGYLWDDLGTQGLRANIEARIPKPEDISDDITVTLHWKYIAPMGYQSYQYPA